MYNMVQFPRLCAQNTFIFILKIWEIVEKLKTDVDRLPLFQTIKKYPP